MPGIHFDFDTQSRDKVDNTSGQRCVLISPNFSEQFLPRDNRTRTFTHVMENFHLTLGKCGGLVTPFGRVPLEVKTKFPQHETIRCGMHSTENCIDACKEFLNRKWFCDVVIRTQFKSTQLVVLVSASSNYNHSGAKRRVREMSANLESIQSRQHNIEQDQLRSERIGLL